MGKHASFFVCLSVFLAAYHEEIRGRILRELISVHICYFSNGEDKNTCSGVRRRLMALVVFDLSSIGMNLVPTTFSLNCVDNRFITFVCQMASCWTV